MDWSDVTAWCHYTVFRDNNDAMANHPVISIVIGIGREHSKVVREFPLSQ
jgi:hypothetical protein